MDTRLTLQYQGKTEGQSSTVVPGQSNAAPWLYPWSEPVRQKIAPALAIALAASGAFAPILDGIQPGPSNAAPWEYAWSEPVRQKPRLITGANPDFFFHSQPVTPQDWRQWLSEPVREKPGLRASLQQFLALDAQISPNINTSLQGYNWWSEPVREKLGLKAHLQQTVAMPPRYLPTPDVTAVMAATETNNDVFLGAINVYNSGGASAGYNARVSIVEIGPNNDPVSIEEV